MKIGIVGTRSRNSDEDYNLVENKFLSVYKKGDVIVSGGCSLGGDRFAERIAVKYLVPILIHKAQWNIYGNSAGLKRYTYIAEDTDILIACVSITRTGGTEDTIRKFLKIKEKDKLILC